MRRTTWSRLETNGLLLLSAQAIVAVAGLVFWALVARFYPASDVGLAVALINAAALIAQVAVFGTNQAVVRYSASDAELSRMLATGLWVVGAVGAILGLVVGIWSLGNAAGNRWVLLAAFVFACVVMPSNVVLDSAMLVRNAVGVNNLGYLVGSGVRIGLLLPLAALGPLGVLLAHALSFAVTAAVSATHLLRAGAMSLRLGFDAGLLRTVARFATSSHVAGLAWTAPTLLYPILALAVLGPSAGAHLYMALSISGLLQMIPLSTSNALFSEASRDPARARALGRRSLLTSLAVTTAGGVAVLVLGQPLLTLFGREYAEAGWLLLTLLVPCQLVVCLNLVANSLAKVGGDMRGLLVRNLAGAIVSVAVCAASLSAWGNLAVAAGVAAGQLLMLLLNGRYLRDLAARPITDEVRAPLVAEETT